MGPVTLRCIKDLLPIRWKREARRLISPLHPPDDFPPEAPRLIVALAADYANLGDVAITRAVVRFAGHHLPSHRPYLLCAGHLFHDLRGVARAVDKDDVVAIVGGGNMGDRYADLEEARCHVVTAFRSGRVVSFPQSFDFSDTPVGRHALARSAAAYASHPRLHLFARERESFRRMRRAFPACQVGLAPDIVFSLDLCSSPSRDLPLLICLRDDSETRLEATHKSAVIEALRSHVPDALITDTIVPGPRLGYRDYERHLDALWREFARARCVVTDRLHGLIFSVISHTPCVVIENNNHKIRSTCETWLADSPSIRLLTEPTPAAVEAAVEQLSSTVAPRTGLKDAFMPLAEALGG